MFCIACGKSARIDENELCKKCAKEYRICQACGGLYLKKELTNGVCEMCDHYEKHREEK